MDKALLILNDAIKDIDAALTIKELDIIKTKYLGKSGQITSLMQELKNLSLEEKKIFGGQINHIKKIFEEKIAYGRDNITKKLLELKLMTESIDVTLGGRNISSGGLHPISIVTNRMLNIFASLGFMVTDGPEIESDFYNFAALNIPPNHPARAMQDTFYTENNQILRTHTSPVQVRFAQSNPLPIKILAPGRVFRIDMDATHSPMFHQLEGLWIDKGISFANLKGVIIEFLKIFFNKPDLKIRFRASFFPFTEPSAEVDILSDKGKWLEVMGCGMVHPNVLKNMGIDAQEYSGFAFGMGIDRFTMLKYNISDLRLMFENDMRFLEQFNNVSEVST